MNFKMYGLYRATPDGVPLAPGIREDRHEGHVGPSQAETMTELALTLAGFAVVVAVIIAAVDLLA
jgi:hypothetical protein